MTWLWKLQQRMSTPRLTILRWQRWWYNKATHARGLALSEAYVCVKRKLNVHNRALRSFLEQFILRKGRLPGGAGARGRPPRRRRGGGRLSRCRFCPRDCALSDIGLLAYTVHTHVCIYICMHAYICVCVCAHIMINTILLMLSNSSRISKHNRTASIILHQELTS